MTHRPARTGYTLLELAIVVAIIGIISALGIGAMWDVLPRFRMVKVAKSLEGDIVSLRNTAIQMNRETRLLLVEADPNYSDPGEANAGHWQLQVGDRALGSKNWDTFPPDSDGGVDDSLGDIDISPDGNRAAGGVSLVPWTAISGPGSSNTDAIVFSPRGWVTNPGGDFGADGYITLKLVNKAALSMGVDDSIDLAIARSGMVRMVSSLGPDEAGTAGTVGTSTTGGSG